MNSKFYVSLEAARLLKEKGYRQTYHAYYFGDSNLRKGGYRGDSWYDSPDFYPAPTKAEAIDWLESKGIMVWVEPTIDGWLYFMKSEQHYEDNAEPIFGTFETRLEAEEAAIIEALTLL